MHRLLCVTLVFLAMATATTSVGMAAPQPIQSSLVTFTEPTRVCGHFLWGSYIVVHDDAKMAAGGPCTTFYKTRAGQAAEPVVSFHCIPRPRELAAKTLITTVPTSGTTTATRTVDLVEYQIAGDTEAHGVPANDVHGE
jgi:hypothetical protein